MPRSPALPLSEIPTLTLLYKLRHLSPSEEEPEHKPNAKFNDIISLIRHDITALEVSAIVNAANRSLLGGGGVDGAIHARAGPGLIRECETLDGCATGSAKITDAYKLPCEKVIHAVGPIYSIEKRKDSQRPAELLRGCYETALQLAVDNKCKSIAFSCIGTGVYGYPPREAASEVIQLVRAWLEKREDEGFNGIERIIFCCFERKDESAYEDIIPLYFPSSEQTGTTQDAKEAADLEKTLPDPPAGEPSESGQPEAKKQKTAEIDEDWEEIEKVEESASNGLDGNSQDQPASDKNFKSDGKKPADDVGDASKTNKHQEVHGLQKDW